MVKEYIKAIQAAINSDGNVKDESLLTGYSGYKMISLLQNISKLRLDENTSYLEVGVFQGLTLLSVAKEVEKYSVFGVDNFAFFDKDNKNLSIVNSRIEKLNLQNVNIINEDYEDALESLPVHIGDKKIGVYFIDGPHDYRSQLMCLELIKPYLAENAIIVIDDSNYRHVRQANRDFLINNKNFKLLFESYTKCHPLNLNLVEREDAEKDFWNGVNVIMKDDKNKLKSKYPPTHRSRNLYEIEHGLHTCKHPDTLLYFLPIINRLGGLVKRLSKKKFEQPGEFDAMNTYSENLPLNNFNNS